MSQQQSDWWVPVSRTEFADSVKGLLLLFLVIIANFLGTTMSCNIQNLLETNPIIRNISIYLLIYFTINLYSTPEIHPITIFKNSIVIFILYIILMKQSFRFFLINVVLIIIIYINSQIKDYHVVKNDKKQIIASKKRNNILIFLLLISLSIGFIEYMIVELKLHKKFNLERVLFETNKCN